MILLCGNVRTRVDGNLGELEWLTEFLSIPVHGAEYSESFITGRWDGKEKLFNRRTNSFATGLVRLVKREAEAIGSPVEIVDERKRPGRTEAFHWSQAGWLRDYQKTALEAFLKRTRGILKMPTGSGKTEVFCALAAGMPALDVLVLVDTRDLMNQAADRYEMRTKERAGRVGDGEWSPQRFTVATLQTLHARIKEPQTLQLLESADVLVADEVQVMPAATYTPVADAAVNAYWRLGTSATPVGRSDARDYMAVGSFGPICHEVPREVLVDAGVVARSEVLFVRCRHPRRTGSFAAVYDELVAMDGPRNELVAEMIELVPKPALAFVRLLHHGRILRYKHLEDAKGLKVEMVSGEDKGDRTHALTRLQRRDIDVVVCTKVFNKGIDAPGVVSAVNAAAGQSSIDALQRLGRLSRVTAGKSSFLFADVFDEGVRVLERHSRSRVKAYQDDGHHVRVVEIDEFKVFTRSLA